MIKCIFEIKGIKYTVETDTAEVLGEVIGAIHEVSYPKTSTTQDFVKMFLV